MAIFTDPTGPYEEAAEAYRDAGISPIALPPKAKTPPVTGCTGARHRGVYVATDADVRFQADQRPGGNLAVRLPEAVVGIDVDVRHAGDTTLALMEARLGPLPPTLSSTSRDDGSRIMFFRTTRAGEQWSDLDGGLDLVHWGHRYAVAWPSVHPDTGEVYRWYAPDGSALPGVPEGGWASAADLPEAWEVEMAKEAREATAPIEDLPPLHPAEARRRAEGALRYLAEAPDGQRNNRVFDVGCMLGGFWARLREDVDGLEEWSLKGAAREVFAEIGVDPDEPKANDTLDRGWDAGTREPPADAPRPTAADDFEPAGAGRPPLRLEVTNPSDAYRDACRLLGTSSLAGVFRRDGSLVHTPRIGEDGYAPPEGRREYEDGTVRYDDDGPAQVRRLDAPALRAYVAHHAEVFKMVTPRGQRIAQERRAVLPADTAALLVASPHYVTGARPLRGVAHTPLVLADGSVLSEPGYDEATGLLYLPELDVPVPAGDVSAADAAAAVALLDEMLGGFPFVTADDRATFLAALLTPVLAEVAPPPYPLVAIGAPTPGSGKSYLAWILREVHGGVFRAELPRYDEELRKQITTILDQTTGRVVTFDNLRGVFSNARFDGLLTSAEWSDRLLGSNTEASLTNDRLWTVTGNNLTFGGDMRRRVRWVTIDAQMPRPEERTEFAIDLKPWVRARRGELLGALLTLVVGWCQAGRPAPAPRRSDDYALWTQVTQGVLDWAGVGGTVGAAARDGGLDEAEDAEFLAELRAEFGVSPDGGTTFGWTAAKAIGRAERWPDSDFAAMVPRPAHGGRPNAKSLGHWLSRWQDRPTDDAVILRKAGGRWWFEHNLSPEDRALL